MEFYNGMVILFTKPFEELIEFIFNFYDFDNDNLITKEDIRTVLQYIPINTTSINPSIEYYILIKFNKKFKL